MTKLKLAKILSFIVMLSGALVMLGWFLDIAVLKSIYHGWATMKFVAALSFVFTGLILFFVVRFEEGKREAAKVFIPILGFTLFLLMVTLLISVFVGMRSGIESLFVSEGENAIQTTVPGIPSLAALINFLVISMIPFLVTSQKRPFRKRVKQCGWLVSAIGFLGIIGYIFNVPFLYYSMEGWSTAMAFHTALLFVLLGLGFVLASQEGMRP